MSSGNPTLLMGAPRTWDDICFIRNGSLRKLQWDVLSGTQGDQETYRRRRDKIVKTLLESRRDCKVIEAWLGHAFPPNKLAVNTETVTVFLDVQQKLSQGGEHARLFLEEERLKHNRGRSTTKLPDFRTKPKILATKDEDNSHRTSSSRSGSFGRPTAQPPHKGEIQSADLRGDALSLPHSRNPRQESVANAQPDARHVTPGEVGVKAVDQEIHSSLGDGLTVSYFPKPRLPRLPPIWAESRQEVCETFDWFRSYQGGVYHADNSVKGYLLSAFASRRDAFEHGGKLIISHGGGKAESTHCQQGVIVSHQASDQLAEDKSVKALLDNYRTGRPLVLLIDDKYVLFPYDLASEGVSYAVLGFYSIVYAWAEYQEANTPTSRIMRYKFAFRWCEEQGEPWWHQIDSDLPVPISIPEKSTENGWLHTPLSASKNPDEPRKISETELCHADAHTSILPHLVPSSTLTSTECPYCRTSSSQVYSIWVCLTPNCAMFWRNSKGKEFLTDTIQYNDKFLDLESQHPLSNGLRLLPPPPITCAMNGTSTGYAFTRGLHCHKCGRLSCRYQWEQLECMQCQHVQPAEIEIRFAKEFWGDRLPISFERFSMSSISDIIVEPMRTFHHDHGRGTVQTFTLPHNRGHLHHIRTNSPASMKEADEIFVHYQEQARSGQLRLRRWPMRAHRCRGNLLTNYFSHNAGEPYHYVGGDANTVPFEQVPAVVEARTLIQKRTVQAIDKEVAFNEVLSCAYMERQQMAFHSDAEVGLGPLVAGLSLGSPALMHFRLHARHDPLYERRGILLTVVLRHGDVLIMDGTKVQDYYEHTVVPNNFRIAATARQITPQHHSSAITIG